MWYKLDEETTTIYMVQHVILCDLLGSRERSKEGENQMGREKTPKGKRMDEQGSKSTI